MIQLQTSVDQLVQAQQSLRSAVDSNSATLKTLIQQTGDSVNQLHGQMALVEKTVQEVQANTGARIDTMTTQTQGLSDNVQDIQARVGKLSQQMNDIQSLLQSIDGKISGGTGSAPSPQVALRPPKARLPIMAQPLQTAAASRQFLRNALPERAARFHRRQVRSGAAGVCGLLDEFSDQRSCFERAVLHRRN